MTNMASDLATARQDEKLFALVLNMLDVQVPTPVEVIPNHWLRRPTMAEIARIREGLSAFGGSSAMMCELWYESRWLVGNSGIAGERSADPDDWHYWMLGVSDKHTGTDNEGIHSLEEASRLTAIELDCGLQFPRSGGVWMSGQAGFSPLQGFDFPSAPNTLDHIALKRIRDVHTAINKLPKQHKQVSRAIGMYHGLGAFPRTHPLYVLGVFAVIESLLTHDPMGAYDSLGHQIKTKIQLLDRRIGTPLDISPFAGCDFLKVWSKLYSYRSCIAHGKDPNFGGELKVLKSREVAVKFLDEAAKKLLIVALSEPNLVSDLQDC